MTSTGTLTDPGKLYGLANAAADNVSLSQSLAGLDRMVQMALAIKSIDLNQMVFIQYPTDADPNNHYKVIPNTTLAAELIDRVQRDKRIALRSDALGVSATAAPTTSTSPTPNPTSSSSPSPTPTDHSLISGLTGTTAAQRTCTTVTKSSS